MPSISDYSEDPTYNDRNGAQGRKPEAEAKGSSIMTADISSGEYMRDLGELSKHRRAALQAAEAVMKGQGADGWDKLLHQALEDKVAALTRLPKDAQGNGFYALWDQPTLDGVPTARLKLWYGKAAFAKMGVGSQALAVNVSDARKMVVDYTLPTGADKTPHLDISTSFTQLALEAPLAITYWANRVTGFSRRAEVNRALKIS